MDRRTLISYFIAWGIVAIFLGELTPVATTTPNTVIDEAVLSTFLLSGLLAGVFTSYSSGKGFRTIRLEIGRSAILWLGWMVVALGLSFFLRNHVLSFDRWNTLLVVLSILPGLFSYAIVHFIRRAWPRWRNLQETRFLWSLTNSHLAVVTGMVFLFMLIIVTSTILRGGLNSSPLPASPEIPWPLGLLLQTVIGIAVFAFLLGVSLFVVLPFSALFSFWVARRQTRRLEDLVQAARMLRNGDFSRRVPVEGKDELAQLQIDFNQMSADLEQALLSLRTERDKVNSLLQIQRNLTANISHDLRTPLTLLRGLLETDMERRKTSLPHETLHNEQIMLHEVEHLQVLVQDMFTLSQAQANQLSIQVESVNVAEIVQRIVDASVPAAWQRGRVKVYTEVPSRISAAYADANRLEQSLHNLVQNGVRHTAPGGFVALSVSEDANEIRFDVLDSGEGIPKSEQPLIWERYYRTNPSSINGSGLGLAIVKELVTAMKGRVAVKSTPGEGSQFSIFLPKAP